MTKNEILEYFKDINHAYNDCTRYDTLKHMLDELHEPCADAISRQAVLDLANTIETDDYSGNEIVDVVEVEDIKQLPPVKPTYTDAEIQKMQDLEFAEIQKAYEIGKDEGSSQWIPVSERLPEDGEGVLVYAERNAYGENGKYRKKVIDIGWQVDGHWHIDGCNGVVGIAWMPLPTPYKQEVEE